MKKLFTSFILILCTVALVGCENMSKQDIGVITGGVAGGLLGSTVGRGSGQVAAIAVGTVAGAMIGGSIGRDMDENDRYRMNRALESNPVGQPAYWRNARTGANYRVVPIKNVRVGGNEYCREYRSTADIAGKKQQIYGTACRRPDGTWETVR